MDFDAWNRSYYREYKGYKITSGRIRKGDEVDLVFVSSIDDSPEDNLRKAIAIIDERERKAS